MVDEPLKSIFEKYCDSNAIEMLEYLPENLKHYDKDLLKVQLAEVIEKGTMSIDEYESLTSDYYDSPEELKAWLIELWGKMFGEPNSSN